MTTASSFGEDPLIRTICTNVSILNIAVSLRTDDGVLAPGMRELRYGDEILQTLRSEFASSLWKHVSHKIKVGKTHRSHLRNLVDQPFLTFFTRLTGEWARMTFSMDLISLYLTAVV